MMKRADLQRLTNERRREAKALLNAKCWSGAYYLAGYAVECALKACIIKRLQASDEFPERRYSEQCWTHNLGQLFALAGLKADFDAALVADPLLAGSWVVVGDWKESSRYEHAGKAKAVALYYLGKKVRHEPVAPARAALASAAGS
jgi:HEPN domain-containing protein